MKVLHFIFSLSALALFALATPDALAVNKSDLVRCADTTYVSSGLGALCGGDNLTTGSIQVLATGNVAVFVQNALAEPYNLYEVYWLSVGNPASSAQFLGNFVTDCQGNSVKSSGRPGIALVKSITMASDIAAATPVNINTTVGTKSSGVFLVYSRGPYSYAAAPSAPPCNPTSLSEYNTTVSQHDTTSTNATTPFANPTVTPGVDTSGTFLEFLSGYDN